MVKLAKPHASSAIMAHLLWAAIEKIGHKELDSNVLPESTSHSVDLRIDGTIDGRPISRSIQSVVAIGESQTKSSSVNPQVAELVAWILGKLNTATRSRILADLPEEFVELGGMPEASPALVEEAGAMLKKLRQTKTVTARGPIRCEYAIEQQPVVKSIRR